MRLGAFDHLTKPIGREELARVLERQCSPRRAERRARPRPQPEPDGLIGSSEPMRTVQKTIGMLADSDATVLITGETGTGKELVARAIHDHGHRSGKPFVAVNCAAIPAELLESELFGHVRGAFTGAIERSDGAFREAERRNAVSRRDRRHGRGHAGEDPAGAAGARRHAGRRQARSGRCSRDRGDPSRSEAARARRQFREDLFYRLHVVPIHLPPLRERIADIVPLAEYFLARAGAASDSPPMLPRGSSAMPGPAMCANSRTRWSGPRCWCAAISSGAADLDFIDGSSGGPRSQIDWPDEDLPSAIARLEEMLIRRALARSAGNRAEAARVLGIHRQLLYAKMKRYGLDVSEDRTEGVGEADAPTGQTE